MQRIIYFIFYYRFQNVLYLTMLFIHITHEEILFYWNECRVIITKESCLLKQQHKHTGEKPLQCIRCVYSWLPKSRYFRIIYQIHYPLYINIVVYHKINHTGEKPFCYQKWYCSIVYEHNGNKFENKINVSNHATDFMNIIHPRMPLSCTECGEYKQILIPHMLCPLICHYLVQNVGSSSIYIAYVIAINISLSCIGYC